MKRCLTIVIMLSLIVVSLSWSRSESRYRLRPLKSESDLQLLGSKTWASFSKFSPEDEYRLKIAYLRGFFDALQYAQVAPLKAKNVFLALKGADLNTLVTRVNEFYQRYPRHRGYTPASVILFILPRLLKGLPPVPGP